MEFQNLNTMIPNLSISGTGLIIAVGLGIVVLLATILLARLYLSKKANNGLTQKYAARKNGSPLEARTKYPEVDVLRNSSAFFGIALAASLLLLIGAFNWTSYNDEVFIPENALELEVDLEVEPPRSQVEPPPPPPPPPPKIEEVPEELFIEDEDEMEFVDQSIDADTEVDRPDPVVETKEDVPPPPPPPPPPPEPEAEEIFKVVEEMPRFPGCEDMAASISEKKACADQKMLEFLYEHLRYPQVARENNISGTVVVQFVVDEKGNIKDARVARDIGATCGQEALRVVELMNNMPEKWIPGRQRGRAVKVLFSLPVRFVLKET